MLVHEYSNAVRPSRVVLLGAGGFLAPELLRQLAQVSISARAFGRNELDLTESEATERLTGLLRSDDAVVMAAALTPDKGRDVGTLMKNLHMGENVCAAIARAKPAHFIYVSSDSVYDARYSSLLNEESTTEPTDLYAVMHIARERMLEQACRQSGIPLAIVRPCAIYGPGDTHNSYGPNRFVRTALKDGKITLFGKGEERRHHVAVADVAQILKLCLMHGSSGRINAVTGEAVSFHAVAETVIAAAKRPVAVDCLPRSSDVTHRHFDLTGLARAFPDFSATSLTSGISMMVAQS
jgi:nucleoside-diphosphate-sugar epimerase